MRMRRFPYLLPLGLTAAWLHAACSVPEFEFSPKNTSSSNTSSSTGGADASSSSSSTGEGGSGGAPPPTCTIDDLGTKGICGEGKKCTVVNITPIQVGCGPAGTKESWFTCLQDGDCADGTWCDAISETCKPFCKNSGDCQFTVQGECIQASTKINDNFRLFQNIRVCLPNCNPKTAAICAGPNTTCILYSELGFDCVRSALKKQGLPCDDFKECEAGTVCAGPKDMQAYCSKWCSPVGNSSDCESNENCFAFTKTANYNGVEHGACLPVE